MDSPETKAQISALEESLTRTYGPLLNIPQLAALLHRSPEGLRVALNSSQPYARGFQNARIRIGRRVYFKTADVAAYLNRVGM